MAIRYLIINEHITGAAQAIRHAADLSNDMVACLSAGPVAAYVSKDAHPVHLQNSRGVVFGHLFSGTAPQVVVEHLDAEASERVAGSRGQTLIDNYWGGYVAVVPGKSGTDVIRDPSGTMPCMYLQAQGYAVVSSDIETLRSFVPLKISIDWPVISRNLAASDLRNEKLAIAGVRELFAGFRLELQDDGAAVSQVWSPWNFVHGHEQRTDDDEAANLYEIITQCVSAWAGRFGHILLNVSGGLDSSIIAASLRNVEANITCLTMATDEAEGDERHYARQLTGHLNRPLIEAFHDINHVDVTRTSSAHLARPLLYALSQSDRAYRFDIDDRTKVDAFFSGIGGDNVFCFTRSATPLVDRLYVEGLGPGCWQTLEDVCELTGSSVFEVIRHAIRKITAGGSYDWQPSPGYLNPDILSAQTPLPIDPWLNIPQGALPGKTAHIAKLTRIQATMEGFSRLSRGPKINPLLSQPVMEACLRIPSWKWIKGGMNRAVARKAFANDLPYQLIHRRSKGGPDSFAFEVIQRNRSILRDRLLGGALAQQNLLDIGKLAGVFDDPRPIGADEYLGLLILAEAEAWSRHWLAEA